MRYPARSVWAWVLYDFANSPFTTLVITFVYSVYFIQAIAADPINGSAQWAFGIAISGLIIALSSPLLGALADRGGYRKLFLLIATVVCAGVTAGLYSVLPGQVVAALLLVVIANVAYESGIVFYNAFLPDLAPPGRIGSLSGWGWGVGYFGGLLALAVALLTLVQPETPWFGFSTIDGENYRATNLLVALWFIVFSLPLFFWVREDKSRISDRGRIVADTLSQLRRTFTEIKKYGQTVRFLIARLLYNDGLVTVFAFGGPYAAGTFGFSIEEVLIFGIVINLAAGIGAVAFGYLDDLLGAKRTILFSLAGLIIASLIAILAVEPIWLWVAGILIGIFAGPNQSASRSLMGRFAPPEMENEFFGFFAFSGKLTAFVGPLMFGLLTLVSGSQRVGIAVVLVLFAIGFMLLLRLEEPTVDR